MHLLEGLSRYIIISLYTSTCLVVTTLENITQAPYVVIVVHLVTTILTEAMEDKVVAVVAVVRGVVVVEHAPTADSRGTSPTDVLIVMTPAAIGSIATAFPRPELIST